MRKHRGHTIALSWFAAVFEIRLDGELVQTLPQREGYAGCRGWIDRKLQRGDGVRRHGEADVEVESSTLSRLRATTNAARPVRRPPSAPRQLGILEVLIWTERTTKTKTRRKPRRRSVASGTQLELLWSTRPAVSSA